MLAWSEGTDNGRQKTRNHGYDVIVGEAITDYSSHLWRRALNQNSNQQARTLRLLSRWWDAYRQRPEKDFSKSQDAWHCSRLRAWRFAYD